MNESHDPDTYGSLPPSETSDTRGATESPSQSPQPEGNGGRRPRRRPLIALTIAVAVLAGTGVAAWLFLWETTEDRYLATLEKAGLLADFGNSESALAQGEAFCAGLLSGDPAVGYESQRIAAEHLCPDFVDGFEVIPTPEEQATQLWDKLTAKGLGREFASEASAVAHAEQVCASLEAGDTPQGPEEDAVSVSVYCQEYAAGFRTLRPIDVDATFTLLDTDPSAYFPSIDGGKQNCYGTSGYGDIQHGIEVVVKDNAGTVLTTTTLGKGTGSPPTRCEFGFSFTVMDGAERYSVEVSGRGDLHYTADELRVPGAVSISLGE